MRHKLLLIILLVSFIPLGIALSQDAASIEYGEVVNGEITDSQFEVDYVFSGNENDIIVVEMKAVDTLELSSPEVLLLDSNNSVIASTTHSFSVDAILFAQLPAEGEYTIIATRRDGRSGDSVGEYTLELIHPDTLTIGDTIEGMVSSEGRSQYYVTSADHEFEVKYQKIDGELMPQVQIGTIDADDATISEDAIATGYMLHTATVGNFEPDIPYVIIVGQQLFDYSFNEITATYSLEIVATES